LLEFHYKPSPWGAKFHGLQAPQRDGSGVREALGAGSAGPGKSIVLLMDPFDQILVEHERCLDKEHPHHQRWGESVGWALHLRRQFPMLELSVGRAHKIFPKIDPRVRWDAQKHTFFFRSGYRYQFGHCSNNDDWMIYDSFEFTYIGYDELVQFEPEQYFNINTRRRTSDPVLAQMLKIRAMSNPVRRREGSYNPAPGSDPHWVRKRFVDPNPDGNVILEEEKAVNGRAIIYTRLYLPARLSDNPDPEFIRQYEEQLGDKPAHIRQALVEGNWYNVPDSYYGEDWIDAVHVCPPQRIPPTWKRFRSLDWGHRMPGCCLWFAMDDDENLYVERELTFKGLDATAVAKRIRDIEQDAELWVGGRSAITGPADTQLWEERGGSGITMAEEMAKVGVHWVPADKRNRARNAQRFLSRLKSHENKSRQPGIVFFANCKQCRRTIPSIQVDPDDSESPLDGGDDHWHDAVLYGCAYASRGRAGIARTRQRDEDKDPDVHYSGKRDRHDRRDRRQLLSRHAGYGTRA